jgi:hypothetical protein
MTWEQNRTAEVAESAKNYTQTEAISWTAPTSLAQSGLPVTSGKTTLLATRRMKGSPKLASKISSRPASCCGSLVIG